MNGSVTQCCQYPWMRCSLVTLTKRKRHIVSIIWQVKLVQNITIENHILYFSFSHQWSTNVWLVFLWFIVVVWIWENWPVEWNVNYRGLVIIAIKSCVTGWAFFPHFRGFKPLLFWTMSRLKNCSTKIRSGELSIILPIHFALIIFFLSAIAIATDTTQFILVTNSGPIFHSMKSFILPVKFTCYFTKLIITKRSSFFKLFKTWFNERNPLALSNRFYSLA